MSNHSNDHPDGMHESFAKFIEKSTRDVKTVDGEKEALLKQFINDDLGATGKFPEGKINERDEGEIAFAVGVEDGKIVLNFGKPVAWIGFPPDQAMELARMIRNKAKRLIKSEFAN